MKRQSVAKALLADLPIDLEEAARIVLEITEELGSAAEGLEKGDLMKTMRRLIQIGAITLRREERTVTFEEAAWQSVEARKDRRPTTKRDLRTYIRRMLRIDATISSRPLRGMDTQECRDLLRRAFGSSLHSYRKGRAILHSIFAYGFRQEWCDANPVDRIETPRVKEKEIVPLSLEVVERLKQAIGKKEHAPMRLSLHLMLYCGIRPGEVQRLDPHTDIDWKEKRVIIRSERSKTGGGRVVPLRGAHLLNRNKELLFIPPNWERRWKKLRSAAHLPHWIPDVLRHTFASYHSVYFRNLPELQWEMGHRDLSLLRLRYMNPIHTSERDVRKFWKDIGE